MKRFAIGLTSKAMFITEEQITAYKNWLKLSHASYTLDR
jgi:hypothetical protein